MTAQQYAEKTAANIQNDTSVDMDTEYLPSAATSFSAASTSASPRSSSGGGSCCHQN